MKISGVAHSLKPGEINNGNPLRILIALAFFAGTPMRLGNEGLPVSFPKTAKDPPSIKEEEERQ